MYMCEYVCMSVCMHECEKSVIEINKQHFVAGIILHDVQQKA